MGSPFGGPGQKALQNNERVHSFWLIFLDPDVWYSFSDLIRLGNVIYFIDELILSVHGVNKILSDKSLLQTEYQT